MESEVESEVEREIESEDGQPLVVWEWIGDRREGLVG